MSQGKLNSILVTGGAGFLGSHVVERLLEQGRRVSVLDDFSNGKRSHLEGVSGHANLSVIEGDIVDRATVQQAMRGCEAVIHLAVLGLRQSIKEPGRVNDVIVHGTLNCLDAARDEGVRLFLNCSSSEVYGSAERVPMDERHPLNPETPYAASKVAQDMYVAAYGRTYQMPWVTIRPFNMYGPRSHWAGYRGELIPKMIVRAMNRQPLVIFGDGEQTRDFIHVQDACRGVLAVLDDADVRSCVVNFCSGIETSIRKIAESICHSFDLDPAQIIERQPPRPADVRRHLGDNGEFRRRLGFAPEIAIEDGIRRTVAWFRQLPFTPEQMLQEEVLRSWE